MNKRTLFGLGLISLLGGACVADESTESPVQPIAPELHALGPARMADVPEGSITQPKMMPGGPVAGDRDAVLSKYDGGESGKFGVMYVDFEKKTEYVASYDRAAVDGVAEKLAELGFAEGSGIEDGIGAPRGLSLNWDNRISMQGMSNTHTLLRTIGLVGGGCTGTLFGNRLVLTGAHCIFDDEGNYNANNAFAPRRNGTQRPYGTVTSQGAVYPIAYLNDGCDTNYTAACVKNDWAILILPPSPWANSPNGAPGYMGFAWEKDNVVANWDTRNVGYPSCAANTMAPANCVMNVAYADFGCNGTAPAMSDPDARWPLYGNNGKMQTGCDTSPGHSGGPIYSYAPGPSGPYLIGNTVWNQCWRGSCTDESQYSSAGIRINQTLYNYMLNLRASYP